MHHMNSRATYRQLRRLFNLIDTDRSGRIDYGEVRGSGRRRYCVD